MNLAESMLHTICDDKEKIKNRAKAGILHQGCHMLKMI